MREEKTRKGTCLFSHLSGSPGVKKIEDVKKNT